MTVINQIAFYQNRRDEIPNQVLAHHLAEKEDHAGIREIVGHLSDKNSAIASDCVKVLYEIGYLKPELISKYSKEFLGLLNSRNNRMVWGAMIALSTIASMTADEIWGSLDLILKTIAAGTIITQVSGIKTLIHLAAVRPEYKERLMPILMKSLAEARPVDFVTRLEVLLPVMGTPTDHEQMMAVIQKKTKELTPAQQKRLTAIIRKNRLV